MSRRATQSNDRKRKSIRSRLNSKVTRVNRLLGLKNLVSKMYTSLISSRQRDLRIVEI